MRLQFIHFFVSFNKGVGHPRPDGHPPRTIRDIGQMRSRYIGRHICTTGRRSCFSRCGVASGTDLADNDLIFEVAVDRIILAVGHQVHLVIAHDSPGGLLGFGKGRIGSIRIFTVYNHIGRFHGAGGNRPFIQIHCRFIVRFGTSRLWIHCVIILNNSAGGSHKVSRIRNGMIELRTLRKVPRIGKGTISPIEVVEPVSLILPPIRIGPVRTDKTGFSSIRHESSTAGHINYGKTLRLKMGARKIPDYNFGPVANKSYFLEIIQRFLSNLVIIPRLSDFAGRVEELSVCIGGSLDFRKINHLPESGFSGRGVIRVITQQVGKHIPGIPDGNVRGGWTVPQEMNATGRIGKLDVGLELVSYNLLGKRTSIYIMEGLIRHAFT